MSERTCRVCGCTDARACLGGCFWVEDGLCSACAPRKLASLAAFAQRVNEPPSRRRRRPTPDELAAAPPPSHVPETTTRAIDLTTYLVPCHENRQPVLLSMPGTEDLFLATFSTPEALDLFRDMKVVRYARVVQVEDGREFLDSIPREIRVIVDPRPHDDPAKRAAGAIRFTEVLSR